MNALEHYREGERLLALAQDAADFEPLLAEAQAHFTAAQIGVAVLASMENFATNDWKPWYHAVSVTTAQREAERAEFTCPREPGCTNCYACRPLRELGLEAE